MSYDPGAIPADMIPLSVPVIAGREWEYVKQCLDTGWVSSVGTYVNRFEAEIAAYVGVRHAIAIVNGTAALHMALMLAGVEAGDLVLLPSLSFIAPANAVRYCGAIPVFLDVDPDTWELSIPALEAFLAEQCHVVRGEVRIKGGGERVRALLPVHILGHPVDMAPLMEIVARYGLRVIEDATESLGSTYRGQRTGCFGHLGCFSFNGNKIITTGGGGMIVTNDDALAKRARYLSTQAKDDPLEYVHGEVGYNYRLTNIQAAMGCAQLEQLPGFITQKQAIAERYTQAFSQIPGLIPQTVAPWAFSNQWLYTVRIQAEIFGRESREVLRALIAAGISARPLWQALHRSPAFAELPHRLACPTADRIHAEALSLPSTPNLSLEQQGHVIQTLANLHHST